jgi:hypothetical protein
MNIKQESNNARALGSRDSFFCANDFGVKLVSEFVHIIIIYIVNARGSLKWHKNAYSVPQMFLDFSFIIGSMGIVP